VDFVLFKKNCFFFVSIGRKRDGIVLFLNVIYMLIEGEKSPLESQPKSHTMISAICDGAPASIKNIKRYIRGTCIFREKM